MLALGMMRVALVGQWSFGREGVSNKMVHNNMDGLVHV